MKVVIIGSGTGGLFTAVTIKKRMRDAEIIFIDKKDFDLLHPCGLPYVIEGRVDSFDKLKDSLPEMGFTIMHKHEAVGIMHQEKKVLAKDLDNDEEKQIEYDKLVVATGASSFVPPVPGVELDGVYTLDSWEKSFALSEKANNVKNAVVVGAGAIGLETANALKERGLEVTIVEMMPCALAKAIDPDMAKILQDHLEQKGIKMMFDAKLEAIKGAGKVEQVTVNSSDLPADIVVMAAGVRPNIEFLKESGMNIGKWGIIVDDKMRTSIQDVYAVGDIVQIKSLIDSRDWMMQLAVAAYKQGVVAGMDILGIEASYKGALTTFSTKISDLEIAATGFTTHCIPDAIIGKASGHTKPKWCQGAVEITVKLLADMNGRIVGGQAIGRAGSGHRIDIVATAITAGFTLQQLSETEMTYCPAVSETYDVLMQAADNALRKLEVNK